MGRNALARARERFDESLTVAWPMSMAGRTKGFCRPVNY
jgi:hypothetical protein